MNFSSHMAQRVVRVGLLGVIIPLLMACGSASTTTPAPGTSTVTPALTGTLTQFPARPPVGNAASPSVPVNPTPPVSTHVTTLVTGLGNIIGSQYVASQDRFYFVEYNGKLSVLDYASTPHPTYRVLGTGYTQPESVYVTTDGKTAYLAESGEVVRVDLRSPDRAHATVIAPGLKLPLQVGVDEAHGFLYAAEFADPARLVRVDLKTTQMRPVVSNLHNVIGLLLSPDFSVAYLTEQLSSGGQVVRLDLHTGHSVVLVKSTQAPLFELTWATPQATALLVTERDPANKVWYVDLTQTSPTLQQVATVSARPSSVAIASTTGFFPMLVCTGTGIDELT